MKNLLAIIAFVISVSLFGQNSKNEKIKEIFKLTGVQNISTQIMEQFIGNYKQRYSDIPEEFWTKLRNEIKSESYLNLYIPIYEKYYTEKDLDGLLIFYKSETGQKLIKTMPLVMQESMEVGQAWGEKIGKQINQQLEKEGYLKSPPLPSN